jgi:hypothetical protein
MTLTAELVFGGLESRELAQLKELASRDPRSLSEEELAECEALPRWALYRPDDGHLPEFCGAGLCACDGPCVNERADLSDEQREWLYTIRKAALDEMYRRHDPSWELFDPVPAARVRVVVRAVPRATEVARRHQPRTRPREHRPRRRRSRARSPARSTDDDPEPAGRALARPVVVPAGAAA